MRLQAHGGEMRCGPGARQDGDADARCHHAAHGVETAYLNAQTQFGTDGIGGPRDLPHEGSGTAKADDVAIENGAQRHGGLLAKASPFRRHDHQFVLIANEGLQTVAGRIGADDGELGGAARYGPRGILAQRILEIDHHVGMNSRIVSQKLRQKTGEGGRVGP